jgi:hypothetical protein
VENGEVIMVDRHGEIARDGDGRTYKHKLRENENAGTVAGRLTRQLRDALGAGGRVSGFSSPIPYPRLGLA